EALEDPRLRSLLGPLRSSTGTRSYPIEINLWIAGDILVTRWSFAASSRPLVESVCRAFLDEVRTVVQHCLDPNAGSVTPSDFPMANLDQSELDRISKLLGGG
ncbi:MAG: hypothetical protein AAGG01_23380, partial [Planctomycetota bacterium]